MSWLERLLKFLFGWTPQPPIVTPPPGPAPPIYSGPRRVNCTVIGQATDVPQYVLDNGHGYAGAFESSARVIFTVPASEPAPYGATIHYDGDQTVRHELHNVPDEEGPALAYTPQVIARRGIVRHVGRAWMDDDGLFYPLGETLFYALAHWQQGKRAQVRRQFDYLSKHGRDHVVILGQVDWTGQEIDPAWPDYGTLLAEVFDCAYLEFGLRVHLVCIGGGSPDVALLIEKITRVVTPRKHMVQCLESVNEQTSSGANAIRLARAFRPLGVPVSTGRGNAGISTIRAEGDAADATVDVLHTERGKGDDTEPGGEHARQVRQCYDFIHFARPCIDREGPGPASSVATLDDPYQIATKRVGSAVCGAGAWVDHTGSGVFGKTYLSSAGMRYENLEDVPRMHEIQDATRNACVHLPLGIENWQTFNTNHPLAHVDGRANKLYGCKRDRQFVEVLIGCEGLQTFQASHALVVDIYNIATAESLGHFELGAGEKRTVSGLWAYVIVGETRG